MTHICVTSLEKGDNIIQSLDTRKTGMLLHVESTQINQNVELGNVLPFHGKFVDELRHFLNYENLVSPQSLPFSRQDESSDVPFVYNVSEDFKKLDYMKYAGAERRKV